MRLTSARASWPATSPRHDASLVRRLRDAGFVIVGTTNLPEFGILPDDRAAPLRRRRATRGTRRARPAARPAARRPRSPPGMVPIAHGNDGGGSIRIPAACCGLVGLKPSRGRISLGPDLGDSFLVPTASLTRTVAETAQLLDVLAGYELGDATWAPPPAEPFAAAVRARARPPADRADAANALERRASTPIACAACRDAARCSRRSATRSRRRRPPWPTPACSSCSRSVLRRRRRARQIAFGELIAGREPSDDDIEPLSLALRERAQRDCRRRSYLAACAAAGPRARVRRLLRRLRRAAHARRSPQRPLPIGELARRRRRPVRDLRARRARSRRSRASPTSPASRRSRCRSGSARTGCRSASSSSAARSARTRCCARGAARGGAAVGRRHPSRAAAA